MSENIYQTPQAELKEDLPEDSEFFIVSEKKFMVMFFGTLGIYSLYWFYRHWKNYKLTNNLKMLPPLRAIFNIFFVHSLFNAIDQRAQQKELDPQWKPAMLATTYVLVSIASTITDQLSYREIGSPFTDFVGILSLLVLFAPLLSAQKVANMVCGDSEGLSNRSYAVGNIIWLVIGGLIWLLVILGLLMSIGVIPE